MIKLKLGFPPKPSAECRTHPNFEAGICGCSFTGFEFFFFLIWVSEQDRYRQVVLARSRFLQQLWEGKMGQEEETPGRRAERPMCRVARFSKLRWAGFHPREYTQSCGFLKLLSFKKQQEPFPHCVYSLQRKSNDVLYLHRGSSLNKLHRSEANSQGARPL